MNQRMLRTAFILIIAFGAGRALLAQTSSGDGSADTKRGDGSDPKEARSDPEQPAAVPGAVLRDAKTGEILEGASVSVNKVARPFPPGVEPPDPNPTPVDENKAIVTDSGLKYWDIRVGEGEIPHPDATVQVSYRAWLTDGTLFDSSAHQGYNPAYSKQGTAKGFYEGVWTMRLGGIRQLLVPAKLAYGAEGRPPYIPPNADLRFEVELLRIKQPPMQSSLDGIEPVTTGSGLKYWDLRIGNGPHPQAHSTVTVNYAGWLEDGTLIEASSKRGRPSTFSLDHVFPGWREGLRTMRLGGKRRMRIPPELAYGEKGGGSIPPNATLVYEVELLEIKPPAPSLELQPLEGIERQQTSSGVSIWEIEPGFGKSPGAADDVAVNITVWMEDGTLLFGSGPTGKVSAFALDRSPIKGLAEGIVSMKVGGKRRLMIPSELGFDDNVRPADVPADANLIAEIELLGFRCKRQNPT